MKKIILTICISLPIIASLVQSGYFPMQDKMQHFRIYEMGKCFADGQFPCRWVPDLGFGYGYPLFNFYAPGPFYIGNLIHLIGIQYIDTVKILFILGNLLSVISMYILVKDLFASKYAAVFSAALYAFAPIRSGQIFVRGSLSENLAFIFFPLIFFSLHRSVKKQKYGGICLSLAIAGLCLTHNLMAMLFLPILVVWFVSLAIVYKTTLRENLSIAFKILLGLGISSFFLLPAFFEKNYVHVETLIGGYFGYLQHFVSVSQLFISNHYGYGSSQIGPNDDLTLSLGQIHWISSFIAAASMFISRKKTFLRLPLLSLSILTLVCVFLMHAKSTPIWELISPLQYLQFPWRLLVLTSFFMSILGGYLLTNFTNRYLSAMLITAVICMHGNFFQPSSWLKISDDQLFSGQNYLDQLTVSIFDYLPKSASQPPNYLAPDKPEILSGSATITKYQKSSNMQFGNITVDSPKSLVRLPLFDFPGMKAFVDSQPVEHFVECSNQPYCFGQISFNIPSGTHTFSAQLTNTPIRQISNYLSIFSVLVLLCLPLKKFLFA